MTFCPLCTLQDQSIPATVKIQVLSTAYNSTSSEAIVFNSYFTFSHPTAGLSPSQVRVFSTQSDPNTGTPMNTEGSITSVQQVSGGSCLYCCNLASSPVPGQLLESRVAGAQAALLLSTSMQKRRCYGKMAGAQLVTMSFCMSTSCRGVC